MTTNIEPRTALSRSPDGSLAEQELILATLRDFKRDRGDALGILALGIFRSFARGSATAASDLDVYVQTKTPNPYLLVHIKGAIEGRVHRKVDIVRMRERMNPLLKARIEREGIDVPDYLRCSAMVRRRCGMEKSERQHSPVSGSCPQA